MICNDACIAPLIGSLLRRTQVPMRVIIAGGLDMGRLLARQGLDHNLECETLVPDGTEFSDRALRGVDWVVMADGQTVLVDAAIAKLDWAAEVTKSGFISADEEWKPTESLGLATGYMPNLKANHDRNALVAATTSAEILLFIADDVGYGSAAWDDAVRRNLVVSCVGTVGIRLTYPNGTLQHAGLVFGPNDRCEREGGGGEAGIVLAESAVRRRTRRSVEAGTGAFLACRRDQHSKLGGFDTSFPLWFNDIDFCLRLRANDRDIIYDPEVTACHYESYTVAIGGQTEKRRSLWHRSLGEMKRRWGSAMWIDPGFNPHFSRAGRPFEALLDPSVTAVQNHLLASAPPHSWTSGRLDTSC